MRTFCPSADARRIPFARNNVAPGTKVLLLNERSSNQSVKTLRTYCVVCNEQEAKVSAFTHTKVTTETVAIQFVRLTLGYLSLPPLRSSLHQR